MTATHAGPMRYGITAVLGLVIALCIAELTVRWTHRAPPVSNLVLNEFCLSKNPKIGYEPVKAFPSPKQENAYRILVLGDSIAQGLHISKPEDIFTAVMERNLNEHGINCEVLNFGVSGYNTQQECLLFQEKGLVHHPDLVVLAFCPNDTYRTCRPILSELINHQHEAKLAISGQRLLFSSALFRFLYARAESSPMRKDMVDESFMDPSLNRDTVDEHFQMLETISHEQRFKVLVVVFPLFDDLKNYRHQAVHDRVKNLCEQHQFQHLDLLETLRAASSNEAAAIDALHPSVYGHRCAGETIAAFILTAEHERDRFDSFLLRGHR